MKSELKQEFARFRRLKKFFAEKEKIWYLRLTGVVFCSLLIGFSVFYLIVDFAHWYVYLFFLVFGAVFIYLFNWLKMKSGKVKIRKIRQKRRHFFL